jgi:IstB-like ATP binding protein
MRYCAQYTAFFNSLLEENRDEEASFFGRKDCDGRFGAMQKRSVLYRQLAKADLIAIDDFGIAPLAEETVRDLLEILDDRYDRRSTLITSQLPVDQWHIYLGDRTVADAILDRLVHNSYRLVLKGDSMRKQRASVPKTPTPSRSKDR